MTETVKVAVRVRPFNSREINRNAKLIIEMSGNQTIIKDPENMKAEPRKFAFDYSYWSHDGFKERADGYNEPASSKYADQKKVFDDLGRGVLENAWKGYNCSLFAYGQTGSGKSYSIIGSPGNKGIVPLVGEELFRGLEEKRKSAAKDADFQVHLSMMEIYNEQVRDLLSSKAAVKGGLRVRQHPAKGFYVETLTSSPVNSFSHIEAKMNEGTTNRTIASTNMNATSSRAHTIVAMTFTQKEKNEAGQSMTKTSIINIVDLAGSERADSTGATGDRLKEGSAINKSLSTLGNCIKALADMAGGKKNVLVPFRDSVLTKLLNNALGGNSKTVMVAALSPADINYEETLSTLKFADRAKAIKTSAVINESPTDKLIRELREENQKLLEMLKAGGVGAGAAAAGGSAASSQEVEEMKKQMEEQMAANQRELEEMKKSWEEKLKDSQADSLAKLEAEKKKTEERKVTPHFWNLSEDPALTAMIIHFCREGTAKIGNKNASPAPQILMNGLSILKDHATVTNKKGTVSLKPVGEAKIMVNGKVIKQDTELHHNDRVLFGSNHLYVFHHPQDEAKQVKAGKGVEAPTYDTAQEEIAKESGLMANTDGKSKEDLVLQEDLVQLLPMVSEANAMSEELDKKVKFEICLISARARGLKEGPTEVKIKMKNLENGNAWLLDRNNFINRKYLMQEMYQNFMEGDTDWDVSKEKDPFWEPHTTPVMIGTVHVYMQPIAHLIDMDENMVIMDIKGQETGHLLIGSIPCDAKWKTLPEDVFADDPKELSGKALYFKFSIKGARGIPANFDTTYCNYKFYTEDKPTKTKEVKGTINPDYDHERQISFKSVTNQLIEYLSNDSVMIEVWGIQKEEGMKTGSEIKNTKDLMQREKSTLAPPAAGQKTPAPASGGQNDKQLANQIQEQLKKAKAKGMKSVPIDEIEETLARLTGAEAPPAKKAGAKGGKSTSRACVLQ
ncbi:kinesin-like protein KIF28P [Aplysia californica]|uniref:Kinesin-like protein KIF28P n=1 Tax=Aplysia californica TaxID=6500 RepID=A0ABM0JF64_APLCA|nr:kinesin-like protein KIF28P [Aplysia californica]XP_005092305.1 kinesin-like protein KIF28P [Aplysia californica]XP_005092306.1 kinesin-like protein KIF28P [Aplysia californica]